MLDSSRCANCSSPATLNCSRCLNAPEYQLGDSSNVVYCNQNCQKDDWSKHKAQCGLKRRRKTLLRVAITLRVAILTYRAVNYDIALTKVEMQGNTLCFYQKQHSIYTKKTRGCFPSHLTTDVKHTEAALTVNQCTTAMALLGPLTHKLLTTIPSLVEVVDLRIGRPIVKPKLIPGPDSSHLPHTIIKVSRPFNPESWVLDTTGCQYGFEEVLVPFSKYIADRECQIVGEGSAYDATETKDLDYFASIQAMNMTKAQRDDLAEERRARLRFAEFVELYVDKSVLDGSDAAFGKKLEAFKSLLRSHMLGLVLH